MRKYFIPAVEPSSRIGAVFASRDMSDEHPLPIDVWRLIIEPLGLKDRCSVRQCSKLLEKAVATSKWHCPENEAVFINLDKQSTGQAEYALKVFPVTLCCADRSSTDWSSPFRLCESMRAKRLIVHGDPTDSEEYRFAIELIDRCAHEHLFLKMSKGQRFNERTLRMIERAKVEVTINVEQAVFTNMDFLEITRPVNFEFHLVKEEHASDGAAMPDNDGGILQLLRRGHSLSVTQLDQLSERTLMEAIQIVSDSRIEQRLEIDTSYSVGKAFVRLANPPLIETRYMTNGYRKRTYVFLEAAISLVKSPTDTYAVVAMRSKIIPSCNDIIVV